MHLLGRVKSFFKRFLAKVEYKFLKTSNVDLVSKLVLFFTLRAVVPQTDVLFAKPKDFRAKYQISKALQVFTNRIIESILKIKFFSYIRLIFALHIELFYTFFCNCDVLIF